MAAKKMGRPTKNTQKVRNAICEKLMQGESLRKITQDKSMPAMSSVILWLSIDQDFSSQYVKARSIQAEILVDEIIEISDDSGLDVSLDDEGRLKVDGEAIQRARLRVDSRKWYASKLAPKYYGDKTKLVTDDGIGGDAPIHTITVNNNFHEPDGS